ncbi:MAG: hypothetical protein BWZ10_00011 [candidate division BRC1 bacterium ADurb.BinA364]|nr:MAG: hypothetical protein BWZ10_00011 [candidate division BRC1 bacterium ADurb.BinA364]
MIHYWRNARARETPPYGIAINLAQGSFGMADDNRTPTAPLERNGAPSACSIPAKPILALGCVRGALICSRFNFGQNRLALADPFFYTAHGENAAAAGLALRRRLDELIHPPIRTALFVASGFSVRRFAGSNLDSEKAWDIANRSWSESPPGVAPPEFRMAHCFLSPSRREDEAIAVSLPAGQLRLAHEALLGSGLPLADISPDPIACFTLIRSRASGTALAVRVPDEANGPVTVLVIHEKHWAAVR